jgi:hypothetical protein
MDSPKLAAAVTKAVFYFIINSLQINMILASLVHTLLVQWI